MHVRENVYTHIPTGDDLGLLDYILNEILERNWIYNPKT